MAFEEEWHYDDREEDALQSGVNPVDLVEILEAEEDGLQAIRNNQRTALAEDQ